jgi:F-type H+-transporting ATPase subunit delta
MSDAAARRYAQALIAVAEEVGAVDRVGDDLDRFVASGEQDGRRLGLVLESPVFTSDERRGILDQVLPKLGLHSLVANLVNLVNDKRRMALLPEIANAYRTLADERAGRQQVVIQTAEPLTPQLEAEVRSALESTTGKRVILKTEVRPELIGGIVARVGDTVYDSSIRTRLEQMKQALLNSPISSVAAGPIAQA